MDRSVGHDRRRHVAVSGERIEGRRGEQRPDFAFLVAEPVEEADSQIEASAERLAPRGSVGAKHLGKGPAGERTEGVDAMKQHLRKWAVLDSGPFKDSRRQQHGLSLGAILGHDARAARKGPSLPGREERAVEAGSPVHVLQSLPSTITSLSGSRIVSPSLTTLLRTAARGVRA